MLKKYKHFFRKQSKSEETRSLDLETKFSQAVALFQDSLQLDTSKVQPSTTDTVRVEEMMETTPRVSESAYLCIDRFNWRSISYLEDVMREEEEETTIEFTVANEVRSER